MFFVLVLIGFSAIAFIDCFRKLEGGDNGRLYGDSWKGSTWGDEW